MSRVALIGWVVAGIVWAWIASSRANAASVKGSGLVDLHAKADVVISGKVVSQRAFWEGRRIVTVSRVSVAECFKGTCGREVAVKQLGGTAGGYAMVAHGIRLLKPGDNTALFLRTDRSGDFQPVGLVHGVITHKPTGELSTTLTHERKEVSIVDNSSRLLKAEELFALLRRLKPAH